ncbi:MAG TPA: hypothetical protein VGR20_22665, partial [Acidimicrobiia bacterium]|nr:hypothetical protein [Acidimicrobiia bacterium]
AGPGCWPLMPIAVGDVAWLRAVEGRLNAMLSDQAATAGATYVDTYTPSIGHDVCRLPGRKWVEGFIPTAPASPVHPNALGMANSARQALAQIQSGVGKGRQPARAAKPQRWSRSGRQPA